MWALFSRRFRAWVLVAVALPLARHIVHRVATAASRRNPTGTGTRVLSRADHTVARFSSRRRRR
jgi:hypothetical protein